MIEIKEREFKDLSQMIYQKFGIHLPEAKKTLLLTRLQKILTEKNFSSFSDYYKFVLDDSTGEAISTLVNQVSTNFTYFYREPDHFVFFDKVFLREMAQKYNTEKRMRVWCAGCSTGEEAYLLAIIMMSFFGENYSIWDAGILATDISARVLQKAIEGNYTKEAISKIPPNFRNSFFTHTDKFSVKVDPRVQKEVTFRRFNLMNSVFPFKSKFDAIFCRNVMIYFDSQTRQSLITRFINQLNIGGYLFIGHSESLGRDFSNLKYIKPSLYQRIS